MPVAGECPQVTGIILAGGQGRRMGGRDKGLIPFVGKPVVEYLVERLGAQTDRLLISANRNQARYAAFGCTVVNDRDGTYPGPLAGLLAGLQACDSDYMLSCPCDAPLLAADYASRMLAAVNASAASMAVAHDGTRVQNVHLLLTRQVQPALEDFLASGQRKVQDWVMAQNPAVVDFSDHPEQFWNMNTEADLQRLTQYELARQ